MVEILPCHFSAKRHRLDCLYFLVVHVSKSKVFHAGLLLPCFWQTIDMYSCIGRNNLKHCTACRITWSTGETFSLLKLYLLLKRYCHINCGKFLEVQFQFQCWELLYVWMNKNRWEKSTGDFQQNLVVLVFMFPL